MKGVAVFGAAAYESLARAGEERNAIMQTLLPEEIMDLFEISDLGPLSDLLPHPAYADEPDQGRAAMPETFGLTTLGTGGFAVVMRHPTDESLAIRVSDEGDGWIAYACGGAPSPHKPLVRSVAWTGRVWVAITERLSPAPLASSEAFLEELVNAPGSAQDLFEETEARGLHVDDLEPRNVMMREDGTIVLNDPVSLTPIAELCAMKDAFGIEEQPLPFSL